MDQNRRTSDNRRRFSNRRPAGRSFSAVCSNCGKDCQVPFRPTEGKPVYCPDCFSQLNPRNNHAPRRDRDSRDNRDNRNGRDRGNNNNANDQLAQQMKQISRKLDQIIQLLAPPQEIIDPKSGPQESSDIPWTEPETTEQAAETESMNQTKETADTAKPAKKKRATKKKTTKKETTEEE